MGGQVVHSNHLGRDVVLGRPDRSPDHGGHMLVRMSALLDSLPVSPTTRDWLKAAEAQAPGGNLGAMLNNSLGDCTIAAKGHLRQVVTANLGPMATTPDSVILSDYERVDGYDPSNPASDQGGVMSDVNKAWTSTNGVGGWQMDVTAPIRNQVLEDICKSVDRYGFADCGIALPLTAQNQSTWSVDPTAGANAAQGSWGGHDAPIVAYDKNAGLFYFTTWGIRQAATFDWVLAYVDEAYAAINKSLRMPNGYDPSELDAQLVALS